MVKMNSPKKEINQLLITLMQWMIPPHKEENQCIEKIYFRNL